MLEESILESDHSIQHKKKHSPFTAALLACLAELLETVDLMLANIYRLAEEEKGST